MSVVARFLRVAAVAVAQATDVLASSAPARGDAVSQAGRIALYQVR